MNFHFFEIASFVELRVTLTAPLNFYIINHQSLANWLYHVHAMNFYHRLM